MSVFGDVSSPDVPGHGPLPGGILWPSPVGQRPTCIKSHNVPLCPTGSPVSQQYPADRAPRFAIPIAILYRTPGDPAWLEGWTENISKSGILFRADHKIATNTPVEMMMELPTFIATPVAGPAICRGRIVRT